jgi:hypothetical protein
MYGERIRVHRVLVGKPEGNISLGRPGLDGNLTFKWIKNQEEMGA